MAAAHARRQLSGRDRRPRNTMPLRYVGRPPSRSIRAKRSSSISNAILPSRRASGAPRQWWMPRPSERWGQLARPTSSRSGSSKTSGSRLAAPTRTATLSRARPPGDLQHRLGQPVHPSFKPACHRARTSALARRPVAASPALAAGFQVTAHATRVRPGYGRQAIGSGGRRGATGRRQTVPDTRPQRSAGRARRRGWGRRLT